MVKKREIKIVIDKEGNISFEALNAQGSECIDWTKDMEEALGDSINRELKDEYYAEESENVESKSY